MFRILRLCAFVIVSFELCNSCGERNEFHLQRNEFDCQHGLLAVRFDFAVAITQRLCEVIGSHCVPPFRNAGSATLSTLTTAPVSSDLTTLVVNN